MNGWRALRFRPDTARAGILALLGALTLTACGQKGPLFLPDRDEPVALPPAPTPGTTPESEERKKDEEKPR